MRKIYNVTFKQLSLFLLLTALLSGLLPHAAQGQTTVTYAASTSWLCPVGVFSVNVEAWGAGGGGGGTNTSYGAGGGGGGGAYSQAVVAVTPGNTYTLTVGTGGTAVSAVAGGTGGSSWFGSASTILAVGGTGGGASNTTGVNGTAGTGGNAATGIGTTKFTGGNGASGGLSNTTLSYGGGGGSSAGNAATGNNASGAAGGAAPAGGGAGGTGSTTAGTITAGGIGGGGAGAKTGSGAGARSGGVGSAGQVKLTYTALTYKSQLVPGSINFGGSPWCAGTTRNVSLQIKNIGTATWTDGSPDINIGVKWNTNGANWTDYYIRVDAGNLAPNAIGTYIFSLTASNNIGAGYTTPLASGTNSLTFDVVYEGVSWFGNNGGGVGPGNVTFNSGTITINNVPTAVTASAAPNPVCEGSTLTLTGNATNATGWSWTGPNSFISATQSPSINNVSLAAAGIYTLAASNGCGSATAVNTSSVTVNPKPVVSAPAAVCVGSTITLSPTSGGTWVSSNPAIASVTNAGIVTGVAPGSATFTFTQTGCSNTTSAVTVNGRPTAVITSPNTSICNPGTTNITGTVNSSGSWTVTLSNGATATGTGNGTFSIAVSPVVTTTYTIASLSNANCASIATDLSGSTVVTVNEPIAITTQPDPSQTTCSTFPVSFTVAATGTGLTYQWYQNGNPLSDNANVTGTNTSTLNIDQATIGDAGTYYVIISGLTPCTAVQSANAILIINKEIDIINQPVNQSVCEGSTATFTINATGTGIMYQWRKGNVVLVDGGNISGATTATLTISNVTAADAANNYNVILTSPGGFCPQANSANVQLIVKPIPVALATPSAQTICSGTAPSIALTSSVGGSTFSWTVVQSGVSGATGASGAAISQTLTATGSVAGTAVYTISTLANSCPGLPVSVTITVNPKPDVIATPNTQTLCSGDATAIALSGSVAGTTYSWTVVQTGVSGANSSSGTNIIQTLTATGSAAGTAVYTITPSATSCNGTAITVTITVRPVATITATPSSPTICSGSTASVALSSNVSGASLSWTVVQTNVSGAAAGSGNTISQVLSTTGSITGNAVYTVTPTTSGCPGIPGVVTVTVNPVPSITATPSSQTICSSTAPSVALTSNVPGATFSWTVAQTGVSGATAASGNSIAQTLTATGTVAGTAAYTVTPLAGGCPGPSSGVSITVNPNVTILPLTQSICNSGAIVPIAISGAVTGTITGWTRDNPAGITSSIALSGSGPISGTFTNSLTTAVTVTFTITAQATNGCITTKLISVIVDATLTGPTISASQIVCTGSTPAPLTSTIPTGGSTAGYTYQWQSSNTAGGPWTNIAGATGATYTPPTTSKFYQLVVTNACGTVTSLNEVQISTATDFGISFDGTAPGSLCSGSSFSYTETSGSILGSLAGSKYIRFSWSSQTPGVFTSPTTNPYGASHTFLFIFTYYDGTATFTVHNNTNAPITSNLLITPNIYNSDGSIYCNLSPEIIPVTINPVPVLFPYIATVCSGTAFSVTPVNGVPAATTIVPSGTTYSWSAPVVTGGITGGSAQSNQTSISQTLVNPTNVPQTATYTVTPKYISSAPNCPGSTFTVTVTVNPQPSIPAQTVAICNGTAFSIAPVNGVPSSATVIPAGTTYSWPAPVVTGGITGGSAQSNQVSVSQTLTNPTITAQTATYTVTPTSGAAGSCPGLPFTITVTVNPVPTAVISSAAATVCQGTGTTITFTGSANTSVTYTVNSGANQTIALNAAGVGTLATGALSVNTTYTLVSIAYPVTGCLKPLTGSVTVNVNPTATASISATPLILCSGQSSTITFTGTPNAIVTYKINAGANQTITLNGAGTASVSSVISVNTTYTLVSVAYATAPTCSQALSAAVTITVNPNANAGVISGTSPLCIGQTATYSSNGNTGGTWSSSNSTVASVTAGGVVTALAAGTSNITYTISTGCNSPVAAFKTLTVSPNATAGTVSGTSPLCVGAQVPYSAGGGNAGGIWSSSNPVVASITSAGIVKALTVGTSVITYTVNTGCNAPSTSSQTVTVQSAGAASNPGAITGLVNVCISTSGLIYSIVPVANATTYVWTVPTGWTITAGAGTISITVTSGTSGGNITVTAGNVCGFSSPTSLTVGVAGVGQWKGITSDWHDPANWCGGIPTAAMNVTIPAGTPNDPVISLGVASVKNITIQAGAIVTINGNKLQVAGTVTGSAAINATNGTMEMIGSVAQSLSGSMFTANKIRNLIVSNSNGLSFTGVNDTVKLTGLLSYGVSNATLTTNDHLTLVSSAGGTASVGDMTNNGANSGNQITGNVTVERFIPGHAKAWQFMAVPTFGQTINQAWQEGNAPLANSKPGYGTIITSNNAGAVGLGFDIYTATGPTMKSYDPPTDTWLGVSAPSIPIANSKGYMFFVRGDRSVTAYNQGATSTILRTTGKLYTNGADAPPVSAVLSGKLASVGNPYASAIDFTKITRSGNVDDKFYVWDPLLTNNYNGLGGYQTISSVTGWKPTPGGTANYDAATAYTAIQSGQAFFVYSTSGGGTVSFTEPAKLNGSSMQFRTGNLSQSIANRQFLRLSLYNAAATGAVLSDGNVIAFDSQFSNGINADDAIKLPNTGENFGILSAGKTLSVEARTSVSTEDTVFYTFSNLHKPSYELRFDPENMDVPGMTVFLMDKFTNTATPISLSTATSVNFSITTDAGSYAADRFYVVFKMAAIVPVTITHLNATLRSGEIAVEWNVENETGIRQYDVERSADGRNFSRINIASPKVNNGGSAAYNYIDAKPFTGANYYRVRSVDADGTFKYSGIAKVALDVAKQEISIYPNPITNGTMYLHLINEPSGEYGIKLINKLGEVVIFKKINHAEGTSTEPINWDYNFAHGMYHLEVTQPDLNKKIIKVIY